MALSVTYFNHEGVRSQLKIHEVRSITSQSSGHGACSYGFLGGSQGCISGEVSIHPAPSLKLLFQSDLLGR